MFKKLNVLVIFSLLAIVAVAFNTQAKTPDGETPANEGICDGLEFATPGLYGLCIAYCEAQDLFLISPETPEGAIKLMPRRKILDNYNNKKTGFDPDMPCVLPTGCPCYTHEDAERVALREDLYRCADYTTNDGRFYGQDIWARGGGMGVEWVWAYENIWNPRLVCSFLDIQVDPRHVESRGWFGDPNNESDLIKWEACLQIQEDVVALYDMECVTSGDTL
jgi:hypothetical protein